MKAVTWSNVLSWGEGLLTSKISIKIIVCQGVSWPHPLQAGRSASWQALATTFPRQSSNNWHSKLDSFPLQHLFYFIFRGVSHSLLIGTFCKVFQALWSVHSPINFWWKFIVLSHVSSVRNLKRLKEIFFLYLTQCSRNEAKELSVISKDDNFHGMTIWNTKFQLFDDLSVYGPSPRSDDKCWTAGLGPFARAW